MVLNMKQAFPEKRIRLKAVVPYEEHYAGWTTEYQERYFNILEQADENVILFPRFVEGCFQMRNRYMIDRSGHLIAVFNGEPGGTCNTIEYAREKGLEIVLFHPVRLSREQISGFRKLQAVR